MKKITRFVFGIFLAAIISLIGSQTVMASVDITKEKLKTNISPGNCVGYARNYVKSLPGNLWTWNDKVRIINSHSPKKGSVAIIYVNSPGYKNIGHVAVVHDVDKDGKKKSITLREANFPKSGNYERKAKGKNMDEIEKALNIRGYYRP